MEGNREQGIGNSKQDKIEIRSYKDLKVWQRGMQICEKVYKLTATFPKDEKYGLTAQIRDAATSVPSNIAEGYGRKHGNEYAYFLRIARGSLYEMATRLELSGRLGVAEPASMEDVMQDIEEERLMLSRLIAKIAGVEC